MAVMRKPINKFTSTGRAICSTSAPVRTGIVVRSWPFAGFSTPIVASNMNLNGNTDLAPFVGTGKLIRPSYVETLSNGMRVGYLGLMGED